MTVEIIRFVQKGLLRVHRRFILMHLFYAERLIAGESEKGEKDKKVYPAATEWMCRNVGARRRLEMDGFKRF